jgi:hypothetical protein
VKAPEFFGFGQVFRPHKKKGKTVEETLKEPDIRREYINGGWREVITNFKNRKEHTRLWYKLKASRTIFFAFLLTLPIVAVVLCSNVVSATPANWSEVVRFTGSGGESYSTDYFTCNYVEWRIRWSYVPDPSYPQYTVFSVFTYRQGEDALYVDSIMKTGGSDTSGTSYIHNKHGAFYSKINIANTQSYTIIIEQDMDSIPEFSLFIILPMFMIATLLAVIVYRRKHLSN